MSRIVLLTSNLSVQQAIAALVPTLQEPVRWVDHLAAVRALAPMLVLWHPVALNDQTAAELVSICPNIIVIAPPIPETQRRLGGPGYTNAWFTVCPSLPVNTFFAVMPFAPEDLAHIIRHRLQVR